MIRDLLIDMVRALQFGALVTWAAVIFVHGHRWIAYVRGSDDATDRRWASMCELAALQIAFSAQWLIWPKGVYARTDTPLAFWSALYFLSSITAIRLAFANGSAGRERTAMALHALTFFTAILAAAAA